MEEKTTLIKEACIKANKDEVVMKLPLGYKTMVGKHRFLLSGGQKQRIAIVRWSPTHGYLYLLLDTTSALNT